jgi:hypothetical protein
MDNNLYCDILPATLINKNFVEGETECNYELYLLELINESMWFRKNVDFKEYIRPPKEDAGECDCYAGEYGLDFKLILGQTGMQARRELSHQVTVYTQGMYGSSPPRKENASMQVTRLHAALRSYNLNQLENLRKEKHSYGSVEYDVVSFLQTLETDKNILMLYPLDLYFKNDYNFNYAVAEIKKAMFNDFAEAMKYRSKQVPAKDTFLSFIYDDHLVVLKLDGERCVLVDTINTNKSRIYQKLKDYSWS